MGLYLGNNKKSKVVLKTDTPSATDVTFGYEDGFPVQRESKYAIESSTINELGAVVQNASGMTGLLTIDEMISWLANEARFTATGNVQSDNKLAWNMQTTVTGEVQNVPALNVQSNNQLAWNMQTIAIGTLQEE